ncbi:hypothetical protein [Flavobacterium quisquiliarum]|uniref:Uncharacterized protein n=1 Tax=Flavobacterium quisquiliarum TaxID=1834436 RepID=A0ABV8VZS9_9FLAO|nr:hypothetical protein [Flavobacterium quisquiliarum]MBW1656111.1 hypothetical protein [Flavobacterium quisquiliarum]
MEVGVTNKILYFDTLDDAEHDIISQFVTPFLLFANVLQFNEDKTQEAVHNQKNICEKFDCPCLFFSLLFPNCFIIDKYSISTQSYFVNPYSEEKFKNALNSIVEFWTEKKTQKSIVGKEKKQK